MKSSRTHPFDMVVTERIHQCVQRLPEPLQAEILDFVEYLLLKADRQTEAQHDQEWTQLSLLQCGAWRMRKTSNIRHRT